MSDRYSGLTCYPLKYPVLRCCDDYLERLKKIELSTLEKMQTIISADFSDAYTDTCINRLQESIKMIGQLLGFPFHEIDVMVKLVSLVFTNCFFYTPLGLYRQTRGMPMGDYSSRDSLDIDLSCSEYDIVSEMSEITSLKLFTRLVDDVSIILQGGFHDVKKMIKTMADFYPNMPLNVQISFGYSRFLDLHIYNMDPGNNDAQYQLCNILAYKEISSFCYTPEFSNIHYKYKYAIVPISLHLVHTRNFLQEDIDNHLYFMSKILEHRMQNPAEVRRKTTKYFKKKHCKNLRTQTKARNNDYRNFITLKYDRNSKSHDFISSLTRVVSSRS